LTGAGAITQTNVVEIPEISHLVGEGWISAPVGAPTPFLRIFSAGD
jgi:hypothetical protein